MAESGFNNKTTTSEQQQQQPPIGFVSAPSGQGYSANNYNPPMSTFDVSQPPPNYTPNATYGVGVTVITQEPTPTVGSKPSRITCPHCLADVTTKVNYETGVMTHIIAGSLCVLCLFCLLPCCWIPYCTNCSKDASHECPNCRRHIGTYKAFK